ncbi:hypothetical protein HAT2_00592 [Candidatus Similichlamydia laticola]|uniref:Uncharacterized protein n=1 Tax=Candidatus Similichlamydia laticola TaxID=2170265 RepID=A0A369KF29_9BACT|nr:hypothetical protein HAT2_00592 [Candidatus Similichlamydia laticola]
MTSTLALVPFGKGSFVVCFGTLFCRSIPWPFRVFIASRDKKIKDVISFGNYGYP